MTKTSSSQLDCRFCAIARGHTFHGAVDRPIDSTADYIGIASIGAFIEGWSLVLPKDHCLSLRDFYAVEPFSDFLRHVVERVEASYGPSVVFEHGANHRGSLTSCGTDHGHMHIVPISFSVRDALRESDLASWEHVHASAIRDKVGNHEYLFFSEVPGQKDLMGNVHKLTSPVSQFFRKVIAARVGATDVADYRQHLFLTTARRTRERLAKVA